MYSPPTVPPPAIIGLYWTDEDIFLSLERMTKGFYIPDNVTTDVNPYQHMPSNLPDDIWYFMRSEQEKDSEHGFWIAKGEAFEIFRNSTIIGWRATLEFYEGQAPHGQRTNWVMQEYRITHKGLHSTGNSKESCFLCRVFLSRSNQEMQRKLGGLENSGRNHFHPRSSVVLVPEPGSTTGQSSMSRSQARDRVDNIGQLAANGGRQNIPDEDMLDIDYFSRGDYLELDDLADRESRSSSSDNSSCLTLSSEECFDSLALLQDLEDQLNRPEQGKDANFKFSVVASVRPTEVVVRPENLGSLTSSNESRSQGEEIDKKSVDRKDGKDAIKSQKVDNANEGTSNFSNVAASSSNLKAFPEGEKEARVERMKKIRKYLCFMPF